VILLLSFSCSDLFDSAEVYKLEITVTPEEGGEIAINPEADEFDEGAEVEIQAIANKNWVFKTWEGHFSGSKNPLILSMDFNMELTAIFVRIHPMEKVSASGNLSTIPINLMS
jgi:hypothetical protein